MVVLVSDLHLGDGSFGALSLGAGAFKRLAREVRDHADRAKARHVTLVLLGDIFEMMHSARWTASDTSIDAGSSSAAKPGDAGAADLEPYDETTAVQVFDAIVEEEQNRAILELLRPDSLRSALTADGETDDAAGGRTVEVIYVPGNHDRLCNVYPALRRKVTEVLGLDRPDPEAPFDWSYSCPQVGVFARHGHQFDGYNYPVRADLGPREHEQASIGDVLTSHLNANLQRRLLQALNQQKTMGDAKVNGRTLRDALSLMYDIRPMASIIPWLMQALGALAGDRHTGRRVARVVHDCVRAAIDDFHRLEYVKAWRRQHWWRWRAMKLGALLTGVRYTRALRAVDSERAIRVAEWVGRVVGAVFHRERYLAGALADYRRSQSMTSGSCRHVVYGHTHFPKRGTISISNDYPAFYLNTGTFRPLFHRARDRSGFAGMKNMTYVIIYGPDEAKSDDGKQHAEMWTGNLEEE
ncbi:MAG: hypothetical protein GF320_21640 [Armatimonadia bacterium]|nr:hypothetical protein [Armatimonadia bacterium]